MTMTMQRRVWCTARWRVRLSTWLGGWLRVRSPADPGFAVRLDWPGFVPGTVCHDYSQFTQSLRRACRRAARTEAFWRRGPVRPLAVTVVSVDRGMFARHRPDCVSVACTTAAVLLGVGGGGSACRG